MSTGTDTIANSSCPIARSAALIGDTYTLLIVRELMHGYKRFTELQRSIGGISSKTLSRRLKHLVREDILHREVYAEVPPRVEYSLTEKGKALLTLIEDMRLFGEEWLMS